MSELWLQLLNGLFVGASLALVAGGLALVFGVLQVVNFAQGELVMLGAYTVVLVTQSTGSFALGVVAAVVLVGIGGGLLLFGLVVPLRNTSPAMPLLATLGLSLLLRQAALGLFGGYIRTVHQPISASIPVEGLQYPVYDLAIALVSGAALFGTTVFLRTARFGLWLRAVADNSTMAAALGVPLPRVYLVAFVLSAALSGLAGAMLAPVTAVYAGLGQDVSFNAFVVIVAGGLGVFDMRRAALFALLLGEIQAVGSIWFRPVAVQLFAIGLVIVLLALRARARGAAPRVVQTHAATPRPLVVAAALVLALAVQAVLPSTPILVATLLAAAVAILLSYGGVLNVGMGAVFGASAYAVALLSGGQLGAAPLLLLAIAAGLVVALVYAGFAGVASGIEYMMLTFLTTAAAAKLPNLVPALSGGANGLAVHDVAGAAFGIDPLAGPRFYVLALLLSVTALAACWLVLKSQAGRVARAAGRNPLRTASLGYRLSTYRVLLALLAGGVAGLAGWISALQVRIVGADVLGLDTSLNALTYALIGGVEQPILGSALGAGLVRLIGGAFTSGGGEPSPLYAGLGLLVVVYLLPDGLLGLSYTARRWRLVELLLSHRSKSTASTD